MFQNATVDGVRTSEENVLQNEKGSPDLPSVNERLGKYIVVYLVQSLILLVVGTLFDYLDLDIKCKTISISADIGRLVSSAK